MLRMLIDTCVWRHWFSFKVSPTRLSPTLRTHSENFDMIYRLVSSSDRAEFLFNALVTHELGEKYQLEFSEHILPVAKKIVIPLTRFDGLYSADGSVLCGGRMGGSLKAFLTSDGYPQDIKITEAAAALADGERLYETKPRKRELDIEHMESALEASADLFITSDESTIIRRLESMSGRYDLGHPINKILSITKTPTSALPYIQEHVNA
jgi:hypothetical protein